MMVEVRFCVNDATKLACVSHNLVVKNGRFCGTDVPSVKTAKQYQTHAFAIFYKT